VEGIYGNKAATFPCIPGGEGVAKVTQVGANVKNLKEGDWVIPSGTGFGKHRRGVFHCFVVMLSLYFVVIRAGFWRSAAVGRASDFIKVTNEIAPAYAATLLVNPCTSYRLLADFGDLKEGDWIIQNGANSMVGLGVIQMARERGIKTINVVRHDRPEALNVCRMLTNYGGDINVLDDYVSPPSCLLRHHSLRGASVGFNSRVFGYRQ
jgi:trans-2-enoyl-CoA reductase